MRRGVRQRLLAAIGVAVIAAAASTTLAVRPAAGGNGVVQGFALWPNQSPTEYERVAATGANTVYLDVWWLADSHDANSVHPVEGSTTPDAVIVADIQKAAAAGMRVALMPKVYCKDCTYGWRGDLQPQDPHAFLASYRDMVVHYAALGQAHGLWLLFLGSEMNHVQQYGDDWRQIVTSVRDVGFNGPLTYQPNWDNTETVAFWDALDMVAVSAYFPLTTTPQPTVAQIKQAWHSSQSDPYRGTDWFAKVQGLASRTGKKVLIGEVGYRSSTTAAAYPYDEWQTQTPDQGTQANAYQALLETFSNQPWWMGVIWWQWRGTDSDAGNTDMSPKGKAAEQLLTRWWAQGWRPVPGSGTSNGASGATAPSRAAGAVTRSTSKPTGPPGSAVAPSTTNSTASPTAPVDGQPLVNPVTNGDPATINGPSSVARLAGRPAGRGVAVALAFGALLGMVGAVGVVGRRWIRTPRGPA